MGLLPTRITRQKKIKINHFLRMHLSPREKIALDLKINGPLKRNEKFVFGKNGLMRVRK